MKGFLKAYLRSRLFWMLSLVFIVLLLVVFALVFEGVQAILFYQISLVLVVSFLGIALDVTREWRKFCNSLEGRRLAKGLLSPSEMQLQDQLEVKKEEAKTTQLLARKHQEETMDYFTLWAHQIKIPLTAGQLLLTELKGDPLAKQLEQELFRLGQYTDMAMTYLRLESFHEDLVLEEEDLHVLVREVLKKFSLFFMRQSLGLEFEDFRKVVVSDRKWLMVVLEQVLSNAIKYTRSGKISISLEEDALVIADTGMGIQASDLQRVFERGFSGFNGRVGPQSSGLGLYLSKTIMDKLGHGIELTSVLGEGTKVYLRFPQRTLSQD